MTILSHPFIRRVGDRVLLGELVASKSLSGARAQISRLQPDFSAPGYVTGQPLADPYVSRKPWLIERLSADCWQLRQHSSSTVLRIDGRDLSDTMEFTAADLERGLVIELAGRIVLLLHWHVPAEAHRRRSSSERTPDPLAALVGESDAMREVRDEIRRVAKTQLSVLVRGETGTGKELVARALHELSTHADGPFVDLNLGAVPPSLIASELFGSVRGAFTGATQSQDGCFARADGGTLFLDEIGAAPPEAQVALLRTLETRQIRPLGGSRSQGVTVRVVSATDADLQAQIDRGEFREPLLHRLAGYDLALPPLRARRDDIGRLVVHFLDAFAREAGTPMLDREDDEPWIDATLMGRLCRFSWSGNVRQLRNTVRQLAIGSGGGPRLKATAAIERMLSDTEKSSPPPDVATTTETSPSAPLGDATVERRRSRRPAEIDDQEIIDALRRHGFEIKATAQDLGISRAALYAWIEQSPLVKTVGQIDADTVRQAHRRHGADLDLMARELEVSTYALRRRLRELGLTS